MTRWTCTTTCIDGANQKPPKAFNCLERPESGLDEAQVSESSRFYAARSALLMRREVVAGRSRRRVGLGRRRARVYCLCLELCVKFQRELASQNPPARSSVCRSSGRPRKTRRTPGDALDYLPGAGSTVSSGRSAGRVEAPWKHKDISTGYLLFHRRGRGGRAAATRSCAAAAPCSSRAARTASTATSCSPGTRATRS